MLLKVTTKLKVKAKVEMVERCRTREPQGPLGEVGGEGRSLTSLKNQAHWQHRHGTTHLDKSTLLV